ncbi:MAG: pyridoxal-phosphate dependent enzyme [Bacteriovoracales bacterium]|nr:pyridoxal-phosphate dependent enzyme [Bacteriovoracales bacterium]
MSALALQAIKRTYQKLRPLVRETPTIEWDGPVKRDLFGHRRVYIKMEFLQHSGSFKIRGAFSVMLGHLDQVRQKGVIAVSRGNHACAVSFAAKELGAKAKVVIPKSASAKRIEKAKSLGARIFLTSDVDEAFALGKKIQKEEGCLFVHPYEGELTALGTASLGLEFLDQAPPIGEGDVYVACGGGGLLAGVSAYLKQKAPGCRIIGVEPEGAPTLSESLREGKTLSLKKMETIADSLAAPDALPFSFGLCREFVDEMMTVSDLQIVKAMEAIFEDLTLVLEPAGVTALAGAMKTCSEKRPLGIILCGSNIELGEYHKLQKAFPSKKRA